MGKIKEWFSNLLTPRKNESQPWQEMIGVLRQYYESDVHPNIKRVKDRVAFSTMSEQDLDIKIAELGKFFVIRTDDKKNRPIVLAQRLDEIHFKGTERPIEATFWREFKMLPARWEPLYAPVDQERFPYGSVFLQGYGLEGAKSIYGDFFLTSRGSISISINDLRRAYSSDSDDEDLMIKRLIDDVDLIIKPLIPLHIVFDGFRFVIEYTFIEEPCELLLQRIEYSIRDYFIIKDSADHLIYHGAFSEANYVIRNEKRELDEVHLTINDVIMDGWEIGLRYTPAIVPNGSQKDGRLYVENDKVFITNDGYTSCMVHFENGYIEQFTFPYFATRIQLPIKKTRLNFIQKVIYLDVLPKKITLDLNIVDSADYLSTYKIKTTIKEGNFRLYDESDKIAKFNIDSSITAHLTGKGIPFKFPLTIDDLPMDNWALGLDFTDDEA